jgi:hypothetical protein
MAISTDEAGENLSVYRFRWIGYGFLILALIDVIHILVSIPVGTPTAFLQTIGQLVERVVVPLLGFALVFFGEYYGRKSREKIWLRILSWLSLVLAILFFLFIPPIALQTFSLNNQAQQQVDVAVQKQFDQLKSLEDQLNKSNPEQIKTLATQLSALGVSVDSKNPEAVKAQIQTRIKAVRDQLTQAKNQAQGAAATQTSALVKNAVKWSLGALVAGFLFLYLWKSSSWAR